MSYDHVGILSVILCANRVCHFAESRVCQDRSLEVCSYRSFEWVPLCVAVWQNCDQQFRWTGLWYWFQDVHVPIRAKWQPESCDFFRFDVGPECIHWDALFSESVSCTVAVRQAILSQHLPIWDGNIKILQMQACVSGKQCTMTDYPTHWVSNFNVQDSCWCFELDF